MNMSAPCLAACHFLLKAVYGRLDRQHGFMSYERTQCMQPLLPAFRCEDGSEAEGYREQNGGSWGECWEHRGVSV